MRGNPVLKFKFAFERAKRKKKYIKQDSDTVNKRHFVRAVKVARKAGIPVAQKIDLRKIK
jgi:hypothetical protein